MPLINFTYPTPVTTQLINTTYIPVNVSVDDTYYGNTTVYLYDSDSVLINSTVGIIRDYYVAITNGTGLITGTYYINAYYQYNNKCYLFHKINY